MHDLMYKTSFKGQQLGKVNNSTEVNKWIKGKLLPIEAYMQSLVGKLRVRKRESVLSSPLLSFPHSHPTAAPEPTFIKTHQRVMNGPVWPTAWPWKPSWFLLQTLTACVCVWVWGCVSVYVCGCVSERRGGGRQRDVREWAQSSDAEG